MNLNPIIVVVNEGDVTDVFQRDPGPPIVFVTLSDLDHYDEAELTTFPLDENLIVEESDAYVTYMDSPTKAHPIAADWADAYLAATCLFEEPHACDRCGEVYDEARGDGYCGLCPSCADGTLADEEMEEIRSLLRELRDVAQGKPGHEGTVKTNLGPATLDYAWLPLYEGLSDRIKGWLE